MFELTHYKQKQEKSGDTIAENKHRKEEKQKTIFSFPKKFSRSEKKRMRSAYRLHRRTCYTKKEPPRRISEVLKVAATYSPTTQCSTIGDAELNDPVRNGKGWDLSAITTLIWVNDGMSASKACSMVTRLCRLMVKTKPPPHSTTIWG